jgi:hypothetical protein
MNLLLTTLRNIPAFNCGDFAAIKNQAGRNEIAISQMRSLLADHHMKRLAR